MISNNTIEFKDATDYPPSRLLQVNSCGSERVVKNDYTILRSKGRSDYHLLYLIQGWIDIEIGSTKSRLHEGQCAVFYPGVRQMYTFTRVGEPVSLFLHFTGQAATETMNMLEPNGTMIYDIVEPMQFEELFRRLNKAHNLRTPLYIPEENSILLQLLFTLIKGSVSVETAVKREILHAMDYIQSHKQEKIDWYEFTKSINMSYSRFVHLFTQSVGVPPQQYLIRLRIDHARTLLKDSTLNIAEISENAGFNDQFYFSRLFRKHCKLSPREYRNSSQKVINEKKK
jgi:AraC-like DNA-binding protein